MEIIYNCFAGISGDMNLAAMLDLGMDFTLLKSELSKLGINDEFEIEVTPAEKSGINGTQVNVILKGQEKDHHGHEHHEHHPHKEEEHHHHHDEPHHHHHSPKEAHHHHHSHQRNYSDIATLIEASTLDTKIKDTAKKIFWEVAIAEGKVHNKAPEAVHFHEVGATDSIVDIVGAAICHHHLNITHVTSTIPELGGGFVMCQHGKMPVPAPATAEIMRGIPCTTGAVPKEMTTPTGAAILKVLTTEWMAHPKLEITKTAYGIGHRDVAIPNVLRVYETRTQRNLDIKKSIMIECNIDDMSPEELALVPNLLLQAGANDAFLSPIIMKKGRAATMLSVLCQSTDLKSLSEKIFSHTSTIGLRHYEVGKTELAREAKIIATPWGDINYKESRLPDGTLRQKIEFEDLKTLAEKHQLSVSEMRKCIEL